MAESTVDVCSIAKQYCVLKKLWLYLVLSDGYFSLFLYFLKFNDEVCINLMIRKFLKNNFNFVG